MSTIKTISELRKDFWEKHPQFTNDYRKTYRQSDYKTDIRCVFVDYVDYLQRSGVISENLANKATL